MTDHEIHTVITTAVETALERYAQATSGLIATEISGVRSEVRGLKDEFKEMNGKLRSVCEWKSKQEGIQEAKDKGFTKSLQTVGVVIAFISLLIVGGANFRKINKDMADIKRGVDMESYYTIDREGGKPVPMRGDTLKY